MISIVFVILALITFAAAMLAFRVFPYAIIFLPPFLLYAAALWR